MSSPKLKEMRGKVLKELEHIPDWPEPQRDLRAIYWARRMRSLGRKARSRTTAGKVLLESIEQLKKYHNNYDPVFDREFFELRGRE
jgi:hypothetical protein